MTPDPHKHLVLLGAELAHVHLLAHLRQHPMPGVQVTLITPRTTLVASGMLAGFVAGRYTIDECTLPLEPLFQPLAAHSGARWLTARVQKLDAQARTVLLDDGQVVNFDWLSICCEPLQDRDATELALPGARQHGLFVHPVAAFCTLWPRVAELAAAKPVRVAVVGNLPPTANPHPTGNRAAPALELALAIRHRLPGSAVTLITGGAPLGQGESPRLQQRLAQALRQRNVTVLADCARQVLDGDILLCSGARLACDVPVIATGPTAPAWLVKSGLAVDGGGLIAVDASARSISHDHVFAAGPARADGGFASPRRAQAEAARFAACLAAAVAGQTPRPVTPDPPAQQALQLIACGDGQAVAAWRGYAAQSRWAGWLKQRQDLAVSACYRRSKG